MLHSAWSAYRETLLYVSELAQQPAASPSVEPASPAAHGAPVSPSSSAAAVRIPAVRAVDTALLRCWLRAVFSGPATTTPASSTSEAAAAVARWTQVLASWIALRLEAVRASRAATDAVDVQEELLAYQQLFVPAAWPCLSPAMRERLPVLLQRCALPKHHEEPAVPAEAPEASTSRAAAVCEEAEAVCTCAAEARQRVARDQLRIGWDALHPAAVPDTVRERLKGLSESRPEHGQAVDSSEPRPSVAVVHPLCLKDLVQSLQRLSRLRQKPEGETAVAPGVGAAVPWLATSHDALLHVGYDLLTKANASQVERCYHLLPALMDFEACVCLCAPDEAAGADSTTGGAAGETSGTGLVRTHRLLCATLEALLEATFRLYRGTLAALLADYGKRSIADEPAPHMVAGNAHALRSINPLLPAAPASALLQPTSDVHRLSTPAFAVLVEAVEPTCDLLHRYPPARNRDALGGAADGLPKSLPQDSRIHGRPLEPASNTQQRISRDEATPRRDVRGVPDVERALMTFLVAELGACFHRARGGSGVVAKLGTKSDKVRAQAEQDAYLCTLYLAVYGPRPESRGSEL